MNNALALLQNYDTDSDDDLGCHAETNNRKRKSDALACSNRKRQKRFMKKHEAMDIDQTPPNNCVSTDGISNCFEDNEKPQLNCNPGQSISIEPAIPSNNNIIPLPKEFLNLPTHIDDPSCHGGRIRSFSHERGNWASFAYIAADFGENKPYMQSLLDSIKVICQQSELPYTPIEECHISLSKTVVLRLHWIHPIVDDLRKRFCSMKRTDVFLSKLSVYLNDEGTRTFLALNIEHGYDELQQLVDVVDNCFNEYRLPPFYKDPSFHMSIGWCKGDLRKKLNEILPSLQRVLSHYFCIENEMRCFKLNEVCFKSGNRKHTFPLKP